jgi:hypothetical protein
LRVQLISAQAKSFLDEALAIAAQPANPMLTLEPGAENRLERNPGDAILLSAPQHGRKSGNEKFGNRKFKAEGLTWDSEYEYYCWQVLGELQKQKLIFNLRRQVIIRFAHNGVHICRFIPDFGFDAQQLPKPDNNFKDRLPQIIADAKSKFVANFQKYKWQKNMLRAFYSREVLEFIKGETNIEAAVKIEVAKF